MTSTRNTAVVTTTAKDSTAVKFPPENYLVFDKAPRGLLELQIVRCLLDERGRFVAVMVLLQAEPRGSALLEFTTEVVGRSPEDLTALCGFLWLALLDKHVRLSVLGQLSGLVWDLVFAELCFCAEEAVAPKGGLLEIMVGERNVLRGAHLVLWNLAEKQASWSLMGTRTVEPASEAAQVGGR